MFALYLDEFGHDGRWIPGDPLHGHHPLFGLAGVAVPMERWRVFDRDYLRLKKSFFAYEVGRKQEVDGVRPERFEVKQLNNRRDIRFAGAVFESVRRNGGVVFAQGIVKSAHVMSQVGWRNQASERSAMRRAL